MRNVTRRSPHAAVLAAALATASLTGLSEARAAAPAPYTAWSFDAKRAQDMPEALTKLAQAKPGFARVWFYGQVLDLATPGLSEAVKGPLRARLARVADALANGAEPDPAPRVLLDRVVGARASALAEQCRALEDELVANAKTGTPVSASVAAATHPEVARIALYHLLFRAELTRERRGNEREAEPLVAIARRMAESFALALDDLTPWATVRAWDGDRPQAYKTDQVVEQLVAQGLDALLAGDAMAGRARLIEAHAASKANRGHTLHTMLLSAGIANAAARAGDAANANALRLQLTTQTYALDDPRITGLAYIQSLRGAVIDRDVKEAIATSRALRALPPAAALPADALSALDGAQRMLLEAARAALAQGRLEDANQALEEAAAIDAHLVLGPNLELTHPAAEHAGQRFLRLRASHEATLERAAITLRRGRAADAEALAAEARAGFESLAVPEGVAQVDLLRARVALAGGRLDDALAAVDAALSGLTNAPQGARSDALALRAEVFLRRGAFDAVLQVVEQAAGAAQGPTKARLDRAAAVALDALGDPAAAAARLDASLAVFPSVHTATLRAQLAVEAASPDAVQRAFAGLPADALDPRVAAAYLGCAQLAAGQSAEAVATLSGQLGFASPEARAAQIGGRTCLAGAQLAGGALPEAANVLKTLPALLGDLPDPALDWRAAALDAAHAAGQRRVADAASAAVRATAAWTTALGDSGALGRTLDARAPAWPADIRSTLSLAVDAFAATSRAAKTPDAAAEARVEALRFVGLLKQRRARPDGVTRALWLARPPEDALARSVQSTLFEAAARLRDPALTQSDRAAQTALVRDAATRLVDASRGLQSARPEWSAWALPALAPVEAFAPAEGEARVAYSVGEQQSVALLWMHGEAAPRLVSLPGRAALAATVEPLLAAVSAPLQSFTTGRPDPNAAGYKALTAGTKTLLPWLSDKKLSAALSGLRLRIEPDGPLLRAPWGALVVAPAPPRSPPGTSPMFLSKQRPVNLALLPHVPAMPRAETPAASQAWAVVAADAQADAALSALRDARTVQLDAPLDPTSGALGALRAVDLATSGARAERVVLTTAPTTPLTQASGDGVLRLAGALRLAGLTEVLMLAGAGDPALDAERLAQFAATASTGASPSEAVPALLDATRDLLPTVDGKRVTPVGHPFAWGRWLRYAR